MLASRARGVAPAGVAALAGFLMAATPVPAANNQETAEQETAEAAPPRSPPRAVATLGTRAMILENQVGFARGTARWRARQLYRLMQDPAETADLAPGDHARAVVGAVAALRRDLHEQRVLTDELAHVRADRAAMQRAAPASATPAPAGGSERFMAPVGGGVETPFGPARDPGTGVWIFRAGTRLRARPGEAVRAPAAGTVRRVVDTPLRGVAVVLSHDDGSVSILEGLGPVDVAAGQSVRRGQPLATVPSVPRGSPSVYLEIWRGPAPVDPLTVLGGR